MVPAILILALAALVLSILALLNSRDLNLRKPPGGLIEPRIRFDDTEFIEGALKPPFKNDDGNYESPNLVIVGGRATEPLPSAISCPASFVIYSSAAEFIHSCRGFGGPNDGNNRVVQRARLNAMGAAGRIPCEDDCHKEIREIWKGWKCHAEPRGFIATAAVEVMITCHLEDLT